MEGNIPQESGLYFAKSGKDYGWYNLIIDVAGKAPFLYINYAVNRVTDTIVPGWLTPIYAWGPKIEEPK